MTVAPAHAVSHTAQPPAALRSPTLSVIIPCHNAGEYLPQTLGSLLDQTRPADQFIIIEDASTDDTLAIARRFQAVSPVPMRIVQRDLHNAAAARNAGAEIAGGDLLMFLDADDVLEPGALEGLTEALARCPAGVAICSWERLELHGGQWQRRAPSCRPRDGRYDDLGNWLRGWYHPTSTVLWTRAAYETAGRWDPAAAVNNDGDLMMRALVRGIPLARAERGGCLYRRRPAGGGPGAETGDPSVSSARRTERGVASRLAVLEKIGAELQQRGRLDEYRRPIGEALVRLRIDARGLPAELTRRIDACYGACGPGGSALAARARQRTTDAKQAIGAELRRRLKVGTASAGEAPPFGLQRAQRGLQAAAAEPEARPGPTVSVIIPTWNRAATLPRAIDSVLGQTFGDFELLIVDDGSTDGTAGVVEAMNDPRIRLLRQPHNQGVGAARNRGLHEARGEFIAFLDSDDEWLPGKLQRQLDRFAELPADVGLIYTGVETITADGRRSARRPALRGDVSRRLLLRNGIHGGGSNVMLRRSIAQQVGFFDEEIPAIEDYDYWLRAAQRCRVDFVPDTLIRYHAPPTPERKSDARDQNIAAREIFFDRYSADMRCAGVAHLFLLESAGRWLAGPAPDRREARRLAFAAARLRPLSRASLYVVLYTLVPDPALAWLRAQRSARAAQ